MRILAPHRARLRSLTIDLALPTDFRQTTFWLVLEELTTKAAVILEHWNSHEGDISHARFGSGWLGMDYICRAANMTLLVQWGVCASTVDA